VAALRAEADLGGDLAFAAVGMGCSFKAAVIALYHATFDSFMSTALITSSQIRAGRHLANLSQPDIARATGLSLPTIRRAESERKVSISEEAVAAIRAALEAAGVEFIAQNGGGPGVRLRKKK
jgi:hypothetical protein